MKKLFLLLSIMSVFGFAVPAAAQYEKGDFLINPGISLLGYGYGYGNIYGTRSASPGLSLALDYNVTDNISIGGYLGYVSQTYKYNGFGNSYKNRWSAFGFGVRGIYHATEVLNEAFSSNIDSEKWDIYGGLSLGYETYSWKYGDGFNNSGLTYDSGAFVLGGIIGTRYMFTPKIGAFAEIGRGAFGVLTLGATFKL